MVCCGLFYIIFCVIFYGLLFYILFYILLQRRFVLFINLGYTLLDMELLPFYFQYPDTYSIGYRQEFIL